MAASGRLAAWPLATRVISVAGCEQRRASAAAQLDATGMSFRFIEGHPSDSPMARALYSAALNRRHAKRPMTAGEIAVYASHRQALRDFLDSGAEFGLILEDDFAFVDPPATPGRIAALLAAPVKWDIIKLYDYGPTRGVAQRTAAGDIAIVNYNSPTAGMVAYLATRRGAERLLSRPSLFRQIDEDTKYYWELAIRVYSAYPNPVGEISSRLGGSLLDADREALRSQRSLRRSLKGLLLTADRKLRHRWHRSRYGLEAR